MEIEITIVFARKVCLTNTIRFQILDFRLLVNLVSLVYLVYLVNQIN